MVHAVKTAEIADAKINGGLSRFRVNGIQGQSPACRAETGSRFVGMFAVASPLRLPARLRLQSFGCGYTDTRGTADDHYFLPARMLNYLFSIDPVFLCFNYFLFAGRKNLFFDEVVVFVIAGELMFDPGLVAATPVFQQHRFPQFVRAER